MGRYADVKPRRVIKLVKWLERRGEIEVQKGGRHNLKVEHIRSGESYPLPTSHSYMNKNIVNDFMKWLVKKGVCTQQEFDNKL